MNTRQKRKRETPRSYIARGRFLTAEERQDRVKRAQVADKAVLSGVAATKDVVCAARWSIMPGYVRHV